MLTDKFIQGLKAADKPKKYADGGGLFLFIPVSGKKLWRLAYRVNRKAKLLSFGEYPHLSLRAARQLRDEAKKLLASGIDPAERKKSSKVSSADNSFRSVALEWRERQTLHCAARYRSFLLSGLTTYFFPRLGDTPMRDVSAEDIAAALEPLRRSEKLRGGRRLADVCGQICRYAVATGRAERDVTAGLPAALRPKQARHRAATLDAGKLGQIMLNLEQHNGYFPVRCALRLAPLLFVRSGELRCAEWREFDFPRKLWLIPAQRMMTHHEHIVPLAKQSVKILKELREYTGNGRLLFPGVHSPEKPIDISTITVSLRKRGYDNVKLSFAGIRSLAAQLLHKLGYDEKIIAVQLAHQGDSERRDAFDHYQYLGERKTMMQEWADYLFTLRGNAPQTTQLQFTK
jgi:integrase